jgi:hypothetical protein
MKAPQLCVTPMFASGAILYIRDPEIGHAVKSQASYTEQFEVGVT